MDGETYYCPKCKNKLVIPAEMKESAQVELADFLRSKQQKIEVMRMLIQDYRMGLIEAKITVAHITAWKGVCVSCGNKLLEEGITNCPSCSGLNLNW